VIVVDPVATAVATPVFGLMLATAGLLDVQIEAVVTLTVVPVPLVPVATNATVWPTAVSIGLEGVREMETTSLVLVLLNCSTLKVALPTISPWNPCALAVITVDPYIWQVTVAAPELVIATMVGVRDVQVTCLVMSSVTVVWPGRV